MLLVVRHVLPLAWVPLIVEANFAVAGVVITEAGLSFLGLGVQPPEASWGNIICDGIRYGTAYGPGAKCCADAGRLGGQFAG